jgi:(E)-4-hydroxy-3-methylbut-2-enyl-diphosphate synthase
MYTVILDKLNFDNFKISLKASEIFMTVFAYQQLASQIDLNHIKFLS